MVQTLILIQSRFSQVLNIFSLFASLSIFHNILNWFGIHSCWLDLLMVIGHLHSSSLPYLQVFLSLMFTLCCALPFIPPSKDSCYFRLLQFIPSWFNHSLGCAVSFTVSVWYLILNSSWLSLNPLLELVFIWHSFFICPHKDQYT